MISNIISKAALFPSSYQNTSAADALAASAWQNGSSTTGKFAAELERFSLEVEDPDLQKLLSSHSSATATILNQYAQRTPKSPGPNESSNISGFSADNVRKQTFVVTYKSPLITAKSNATLGGQSIEKPTNNVSAVTQALDGTSDDEVSDQEIVSAIGVVVREMVVSRIKEKFTPTTSSTAAPLSGQSYSVNNFLYRRQLSSTGGSGAFDSDFQISLHMDIIECDASDATVFASSKVRNYLGTNYTIMSHNCNNLKNLFEQDDLVASVYIDEELTAAADYIADPSVVRARIEAIEAVANTGSLSDPLLSQQWVHQSTTAGINSIPLWDSWSTYPPSPASTDQPPVVIALIDSGVDYLHRDLIGSIWENPGEICNDGIDNDGNGFIDDCYGWNFIENSNDPMDDNGHGTAAAGLIAASPNNNFGIVPVCWNCVIIPIKALDSNIKGTVSGFVKALNYALLAGVKISNNSYGGQGSRFGSLEDAVGRAEQQGMIFVAASGNFSCDADSEPAFPASYDLPNVISVASHGSTGAISDYSCYGRNSVHLSAPGENVLSLSPNDGFTRVNGTSFAAPIVSGILGMVLNANPDLTYVQLSDVLLATVNRTSELQGKLITGGMADLNAAVTRAREMKTNPGAVVTTTSTSTTTTTTKADSTDQIVICLHDLCPHKAMCIQAEKYKTSLSDYLDSTANYDDDVMACRCASGHVLIPDETPPDYPWAGNIGYCQDINECELGNQCGEKSLLDKYRVGCFNTVGGFECRCKQGFTNVSQVESEVNCVDINECSLNSTLCPNNSSCLNLPGNHECLCSYDNTYWNSVSNNCESVDNDSRRYCQDPRTEIWAIDRCLCRIGYTRSNSSNAICVRAGVLEAVSSSIYQGLIDEAYANQ